jgi:protein-S-isoprenylcysteine O-methyltransferase Ste14
VRHPIYSGVLLTVLGTVLGSRSFVKLAFGLVVLAFFTLKARWEESRLREVDPEYAAYCEITPRFVPSIGERLNR